MNKLQINGKSINGFIESPADDKGPGILVLHAWWGLNEFIHEFSKRLAKEGYLVVAPDLYDGKIATTIEQAEKYVEQVDRNVVYPLLDKTVDYLLNHEKCSSSTISVLGFSLGASWASRIANTIPDKIEKVVQFYGTGEPNFDKVKASFLCHYAENDPYEESEWVNQYLDIMKKSGVNYSKYVYPNTHHWFCESDKEDYYKKEASELAWQRTLEFLKKK